MRVTRAWGRPRPRGFRGAISWAEGTGRRAMSLAVRAPRCGALLRCAEFVWGEGEGGPGVSAGQSRVYPCSCI